MLRLEPPQRGQQGCRKWGRALAFHVDMQRYALGSGREPAFLGMNELLEKMDALAVVIDELERDPHRRVRLQLAQVAHRSLDREAGMPARLDVFQAAPKDLEYLIDRPVEEHIVVGHVQMTIVVDPG